MENNMKRHGFTFVEVCMSILVLSLVLGLASGIISYARKESEKGAWIQQSIGQLRNATRQIGLKMKEMSYPSTLVKNYTNTTPPKLIIKVTPFKEKRFYDTSGRLRDISVNSSDAYEIHARSNQGIIKPENKKIVLMYFPICLPEKDYSNSYTEGLIRWTRFVLEPTKDFSITKLGKVSMEEYQIKYDTRSNPDRAFSLNEPFNEKECRLIRSKELITDVSGVDITSYDVSTLRGIAYSKNSSNPKAAFNIKTIVSFKIFSTHPKDDKVTLNDMCSVTANAEVKPL